jgi:hypothetical protein
MEIIHVFIQDRGAYKHSNVHFVFSYISILAEKILKLIIYWHWIFQIAIVSWKLLSLENDNLQKSKSKEKKG